MEPTPTRILLIEDNSGDAFLLQEALREKEVSPYLLKRVERLADGLDLLSKGGWDLVLLDLFLPDSSGLGTLETLLKKAPPVPVVVLTGMVDKETAVKSLQQGAQDFLVKDDLNATLLKRSISYSIERYRLLKRAQENEERYFLAAQGSHDGLWDWDLKSGLIYFSPRWKLMLGYGDEEIGKDSQEWFGRIHPRDLARVRRDLSNHLAGKTDYFTSEHRLKHKDGQFLWVLGRGLAVQDEEKKANRIAGSFTDITRHKNMEQQLALRAFYDPLTGLPNRALFMENLKRLFIKKRRRPWELFSLMFLDLDRFKLVNDNLGHQAGDELLVNFAKRLGACVRPNDSVARMGGDEFTVLLENLQDPLEAVDVARRILTSLRSPFRIGGKEVTTAASIGIAYSNYCGKDSPDGLLQAADSAMYRAKVAGKGRYEIFGQKDGLGWSA